MPQKGFLLLIAMSVKRFFVSLQTVGLTLRSMRSAFRATIYDETESKQKSDLFIID